MATNRWLGDSAGTAQVTKVVPANPEIGDKFILTCNRKSITVIATDTTLKTLISRFVSAITAAAQSITEFGEFSATAGLDAGGNYTHILLTGKSDGTPFTVSGSAANVTIFNVVGVEVVKGEAARNMKQRVTIPGVPSAGTFTLTFADQTSTGINYNGSAADVKSALEALSTVGSSNTSVVLNGLGDWTVEFVAALATKDQPIMQATPSGIHGACTIAIVTTTNGAPINYAKGPRYRLTLATGIDRFRFQLTAAAFPDAVYYSKYLSNLGTGATDQDVAEALSSLLVPLSFNLDTATSDADTTPVIPAISLLDVRGPAGGPWEIIIRDGIAIVLDSSAVLDVDGLSIDPFGSTATCTHLSNANTAAVAEVQKVAILGGPASSGTFTLSIEGYTTAGIARNATNYDVRDKLCDLNPPIGGTDAVWTLTPGGTWSNGTFDLRIKTFIGDTGQAAAGLVYNISNVDLQAALQALSHVGSGGLIVTGGPIASAATTFTFRAAVGRAFLDATSTLSKENFIVGGSSPTLTLNNVTPGVDGGVTVTGTGVSADPWVVTFSTLFQRDFPEMTADASSLVGCQMNIQVAQDASTGVNEQQQIFVTSDGTPTGGTFALTFNGETTSGIAYNADAATVLAALVALTTPGPLDLAVTGGPFPSQGMVIEYKGQYANSDVALITGDGTSLTGSNTQTLTVSANTVNPTGPFHVDNVNNWSLGALPVSTNDIIITGANPIKYGLTALAAVVPNSLTIDAEFTGTIGLEYDNGNYLEYRQRKLQIGGSGAFTTYIGGTSDGSASKLVGLDFQTANVKVVIQKSAQPDSDRPAVLLLLNHSSAEVNCERGSVGIAFDAGETSTLAKVRESYIATKDSDSFVVLGIGATCPIVEKYAGSMICYASISTSFTQVGGDTDFNGTATMAQLYVRGGDFNYNSSGTLAGATVVSGSGVLNYDGDSRAKTITNAVDVYGDVADVKDSFKIATTTGESPAALVIDYNESTRNPNLGSNYRLKRMATA